MNEIEAFVYETRRLLAALIGSTEPPSPVLRPLVAGVIVGAALVGAQVARTRW